MRNKYKKTIESIVGVKHSKFIKIEVVYSNETVATLSLIITTPDIQLREPSSSEIYQVQDFFHQCQLNKIHISDDILAIITNIDVNPNYQRRKIGSELIIESITQIKKYKIKKILALVIKNDEDARGFWNYQVNQYGWILEPYILGMMKVYSKIIQ